jgi:hypothetical protein
VKPPGFFAGQLIWSVQTDRILIGKQGQTPAPTLLTDILSITPATNSSKPGLFKFATKQNQDAVEEKCTNLEQMKALLEAIYTNQYILKLPPPGEQPEGAPPAAAPPA